MRQLPKADERLTEQLTNAETHNSVLQAWFQLKQEGPLQAVPQRNENLAREIVGRVKQKLGDEEASVIVQPNIGAFTVAAKPNFIRQILNEAEVVQGRSTSVPLDLIKPIEKYEVKLPSARSSRLGAAARKRRAI